MSDLAVKPAETIVSLVSYEENRGKKMISWIIQREDLTSKSLPCYYMGTSKSAYVATQHDNCSTHLFLKSFYMWYMLKEPRREGLLTPFFLNGVLNGSELEIREHWICSLICDPPSPYAVNLSRTETPSYVCIFLKQCFFLVWLLCISLYCQYYYWRDISL